MINISPVPLRVPAEQEVFFRLVNKDLEYLDSYSKPKEMCCLQQVNNTFFVKVLFDLNCFDFDSNDLNSFELLIF